MMKVISTVLAMSMLVLTGCSTMNGNTQPLYVSVNPNNAKFHIDGGTYTGSQTVEVRRKPQSIQAYAPGHDSASTTVSTKMSDLAKVDIFVGLFLFWPCLIGLAHPGARQLKQDTVALRLTPNAQQYAKPEQVREPTADDLMREKYFLDQKLDQIQKREWDYEQWKAQQTQTPVGQ